MNGVERRFNLWPLRLSEGRMKPLPALTSWLLVALHGSAGAAPADTLYTRPGRMVATGDGARLNLYCTGRGLPTVVFDSGWEDWAPAWATVQPRIAEWTRECRDAIAEGKPPPALPARPDQPPRTCAQQFFRGLPEAAWSPELNAKVLELAQTKVAMYDAYFSEMEHMREDEEYLQQHRFSLGSRPVRVLTTGNHGVGHLPATPDVDPKHLEFQHQIAQAQARWLELSSNARQIFTRHSSEYVQFDEPDAVVDAIREAHQQSQRSDPAR